MRNEQSLTSKKTQQSSYYTSVITQSGLKQMNTGNFKMQPASNLHNQNAYMEGSPLTADGSALRHDPPLTGDGRGTSSTNQGARNASNDAIKNFSGQRNATAS